MESSSSQAAALVNEWLFEHTSPPVDFDTVWGPPEIIILCVVLLYGFLEMIERGRGKKKKKTDFR